MRCDVCQYVSADSPCVHCLIVTLAGADTILASILTFFLAMLHAPEVQKKAQAEIDLVIGNDRLPSATDYDQLPYIQAVMSEVFRYHPVAPMDIPHRVAQDDIYKGYLIPRNSTVIINAW